MRPITGRSWTGWLRSPAQRVYGAADGFGSELFGSRAYRQGRWKLTDIGDGIWRLFDIARDPGETRDLSFMEPAKREELAEAWLRYSRDVGVVAPDSIPYRP